MNKQNKLETLAFGQIVTRRELDKLDVSLFVRTKPTFWYSIIGSEAYLLQRLKGKTERYKIITKYNVGGR